jgi:hypothetical protein
MRVPRQFIVPIFPPILWSKLGPSCGSGRLPISGDNAPSWSYSYMLSRCCPMSVRRRKWNCIPTPCGTGGAGGPRGSSSWTMPLDAGAESGFPPLDQALVKAVACERLLENTLARKLMR